MSRISSSVLPLLLSDRTFDSRPPNILTSITNPCFLHRDLKPENLLLTSKEDDAHIKIADFGFAIKSSNGMLATQCGTPGYIGKLIGLECPAPSS
jgi:serine/threonine protein kinase